MISLTMLIFTFYIYNSFSESFLRIILKVVQIFTKIDKKKILFILLNHVLFKNDFRVKRTKLYAFVKI